MKIRIEPYKRWSGGAKALGLRTGILRATHKQVKKYGDFDIVINWGNSERRFHGEYIDIPEAVANASNKLWTAKIFGHDGVPQPPFTTDRDVAQGWYDEGTTVVCRTLLRASEGRGIVLASAAADQQIVKAPLYAKYIKKAAEYRIHVAFKEVIDAQQKKRRLEVPDEKVNWQIRNAHNGWVYTRDNVNPPVCVSSAARDSVASLELDFGAVDIGYNDKAAAAMVYEVNTAPGLEGSTIDSYYTAFQKRLPQINSGAYRRRRSV